MTRRIFVFVLFILPNLLFAQEYKNSKSDSPYKITWKDGVITGAGIGASYWGLTIMQDKEGVSQAELDRISENLEEYKENVPFFDRFVFGNYSPEYDRISDIPFYSSFSLPFFYLANKKTRKDFWTIGLLYVESMAITGTTFTQVAGRVNRKRPLVYNLDPENDDRDDEKGQNSFFGGHVAATATATFFTAKVFNDYFPDSKLKPYVWGVCAVLPATVAYMRMEAGKHFLSDNVIGYSLGTAVGILVPHLHKVSKKNPNLSVFPAAGGGYDGLVMIYKF